MPKYTTCSNWKCLKCKTINRVKGATKCLTCGTAKEKGESQDVLPGDWKCGCGTNNFASRMTCYSCKRSRMPKYTTCSNWKCLKCETINRVKGATKCLTCGTAKEKGESQDVLPGDWKCGCGTNNFASRMTCYSCKRPRRARK